MKIKDKNREKIPEKVRREQDEQMEKFLAEEQIIIEGIQKIEKLL